MHLTVLNLFNTKVEGNVQGLAPLVHLTELYLDGTKVEGNVQAFKQTIPGLRGGN